MVEKERPVLIHINGKDQPFVSACTLLDLLEQLGFDPARIALELNGDIIARDAFAQTLLHDGDHVEIVQFVGGG